MNGERAAAWWCAECGCPDAAPDDDVVCMGHDEGFDIDLARADLEDDSEGAEAA